ncbi:MAG: hypothetical protein FNT29_11650 [Halothiobacillaceae bacterium]|jgi:hypothetical protein|nr:MAG: hypothetical protein FNT29_11650 [Halothiobacillaceae bacterium]
MKTILIATTAAALVLGNSAFAAGANKIPSAKASTVVSDTVLIEAVGATQSADEVLHTTIKVPEQKEMIFDVSMECGLYTNTLVKSKGGTADTSTAEAAVDVNVAYQMLQKDGSWGPKVYALPGGDGKGVTFCQRKQELMAKFQGIFQQCDVTDPATGECLQYGSNTCLITEGVDTNGDGVHDSYTTTLDIDCLAYEEVGLVLSTMNANAFNFVAPNLQAGIYRVAVEAEISSGTTAQAGSSSAKALIGRGSLVVDESRFVQP